MEQISGAGVPELKDCGNGVWAAPGARIVDRAGERRLPIGDDGFERAAAGSVLVDKTMLVADVLSSGYTATLFCRPRRFGKTLNMTMLKAFLELPPDGRSRAALFEGTQVWEAEGGRWREHQGAYPVIYLSMRTAKKDTWAQTYGSLRNLIIAEYTRFAFLATSERLGDVERTRFGALLDGTAGEVDYADSLLFLAQCLKKHYGRNVVVLVDEYDAPVMAGYTHGYYAEVVSFLKGWLTGALKDGGSVLAFACLTGVQRISKESIFSDLNNLTVSTALSTKFDERFGFTDAEVAALAAYLGHPGCMEETRFWYDGYRFGNVSVYNPWSLLNYFDQGCVADVYWGNTSSNSVVGDLVRHADASTLDELYALLERGNTVVRPLDLGIVFSDAAANPDTIWSLLYLAGYLTTEDTALPNNTMVNRRLRIPNEEIALLYRKEIVNRFAAQAGGSERLRVFQRALAAGDEEALGEELGRIVRDSASYLDVVSENAAHMLLLGLCFGIVGYGDPVSNREAGQGRPDVQLRPAPTPFFVVRRPLLTIELKYSRAADDDALVSLASEALAQIVERGYDADPPADAYGRVRWGIAFSGKRVAVAAEKLG